MLPKSNSGATIGFAAGFIFVAILSQFSYELGAGHIPIPEELKWLVPIIGAGCAATITVMTPYFSLEEFRQGRRTIESPPDTPVRVNPPSSPPSEPPAA